MGVEVKEKDYQNDWAFNEDFKEHIHISDAKRGLQGYYCLGCKKEMQAVKGQKKAHYYRHHASNVDKDKTECVVANRNYRERLAKDILQRLKQLKLPEVYKFPPVGVNGAPNLLKSSEIIVAHSVKSELTFYENEDCEVKFGKNDSIDKRYLLIRPDVTFFNKEGMPILLVEFVVTHKIDNEKRNKLNRLGLNTVQIIIPKKNGEEIEQALKSKSKLKWVYNDLEAKHKYVFVSKGNNQSIWSIDDDQRRIFEESYTCRTSQLKYLIRTVKRAFESQSYKRTEQRIRQQISRVEDATKRERQGLEDLERQHGAEEFTEQERCRNEKTDLERRYKSKECEIREDQSKEGKLIQEYYNSGSLGKEIKERYRIKERGIWEDIQFQQGVTEKLRLEEEAIPEAYRQLEERAGEDFEEELGFSERRRGDVGQQIDGFNEYTEREVRLVSKKHEDLKAREQRVFEFARDRIERDKRAIQSKIESFDEFTNQEEGSLEDEFEKLREETTNRINKKDSSGESELSKRIEAVLNVGRISLGYRERQDTYERYRSYLELARSRAWEK